MSVLKQLVQVFVLLVLLFSHSFVYPFPQNDNGDQNQRIRPVKGWDCAQNPFEHICELAKDYVILILGMPIHTSGMSTVQDLHDRVEQRVRNFQTTGRSGDVFYPSVREQLRTAEGRNYLHIFSGHVVNALRNRVPGTLSGRISELENRNETTTEEYGQLIAKRDRYLNVWSWCVDRYIFFFGRQLLENRVYEWPRYFIFETPSETTSVTVTSHGSDDSETFGLENLFIHTGFDYDDTFGIENLFLEEGTQAQQHGRQPRKMKLTTMMIPPLFSAEPLPPDHDDGGPDASDPFMFPEKYLASDSCKRPIGFALTHYKVYEENVPENLRREGYALHHIIGRTLLRRLIQSLIPTLNENRGTAPTAYRRLWRATFLGCLRVLAGYYIDSETFYNPNFNFDAAVVQPTFVRNDEECHTMASFLWLPGNLFYGFEARNDNPNDEKPAGEFERNCEIVVGKEKYQQSLSLYNRMSHFVNDKLKLNTKSFAKGKLPEAQRLVMNDGNLFSEGCALLMEFFQQNSVGIPQAIDMSQWTRGENGKFSIASNPNYETYLDSTNRKKFHKDDDNFEGGAFGPGGCMGNIGVDLLRSSFDFFVSKTRSQRSAKVSTPCKQNKMKHRSAFQVVTEKYQPNNNTVNFAKTTSVDAPIDPSVQFFKKPWSVDFTKEMATNVIRCAVFFNCTEYDQNSVCNNKRDIESRTRHVKEYLIHRGVVGRNQNIDENLLVHNESLMELLVDQKTFNDYVSSSPLETVQSQENRRKFDEAARQRCAEKTIVVSTLSGSAVGCAGGAVGASFLPLFGTVAGCVTGALVTATVSLFSATMLDDIICT